MNSNVDFIYFNDGHFSEMSDLVLNPRLEVSAFITWTRCCSCSFGIYTPFSSITLFLCHEVVMLIHSSAQVDSSFIGDGTRIWQFCVVMEGAVIGEYCNIGAHCFIEVT